MGTRFLLIRHASVDSIGKRITGREPCIHLNEQGRAEACELPERLTDVEIDAIYSSPMERTMETAEPVARSKSLKVVADDHFSEIDFGEWTGKSFSELVQLAEWKRFNECRSMARIPGGESMLDVEQRMMNGIGALQRRHESATIAIVSHCDPIRIALVHIAGMNLDAMLRLAIAPASISAVEIDSYGAKVLCMNHVGGRFAIRTE